MRTIPASAPPRRRGAGRCRLRFATGPDVRFATFNASLNRAAAGLLTTHLSNPASTTCSAARRRTSPRSCSASDPTCCWSTSSTPRQRRCARGPEELFRDNFLQVSQNGAPPIKYPYAFIAPSNTGIATGKDLNNNGVAVTTPGRPATATTHSASAPSRASSGWSSTRSTRSSTTQVRTFQLFRWKDMPGNLIPTPFYSPDEVEILRLSSKSHWDIPIEFDRKIVHFLVSHPTPPVFDGPRTETAGGTSTRSASGPTTSRRASRATSTTTRGQGRPEAGRAVRHRR